MFSSAGTAVSSMSASRSRQSGASPAKASRGFSVSIFKAPTLVSSFQSASTIKFNRSSSFQNSGVQQAQQNRLSSWSWFNSTSNPPKPAGKASSIPVGGETHPSHQTATSSFYIYPSTSTNGTYIYQPSINSAKSEIYSNSDYDASTASLATASSVLSSSLSTDTVLTSPSSQNVPLPLPAPPPALAKALSSSGVQFGAVSDRHHSQTGTEGRVPPTPRESSDQRPGFQPYSTASSYQAAHEGARGNPSVQISSESDDEEFNRISRRNTEYNSRTSYPQAFRPVSSYPPAQMTQSEIITTDNTDSHRASSLAASFPVGMSRSVRTVGPQIDAPGPSRQRSIPLPSALDDPPLQSAIASVPIPYNAAFRRNTAFMPYYFPDAVVSEDPEQQKTSPHSSIELPRPAVPPGLAHSEMAGRQTPDSETNSNPESRNSELSPPNLHEGSSGDDLSRIPILSYNETVSPPAAHAIGMDVPRNGRAPYNSQKVDAQEHKRTYAAVAAPATSESSDATTSFPRVESQDILPSSQSPPYNTRPPSPVLPSAGAQRASSMYTVETNLPPHRSTSASVPNMALPPTLAPGPASQLSAPRISTNDTSIASHEQRRSPREEITRAVSRIEGSFRPFQNSLAQQRRAPVLPELPRPSNDRRSCSETRYPTQGSVHTEQVSQVSPELKNSSAGVSAAVTGSSCSTSWQNDRDRSRRGSVSLAPPIQSINEAPVPIQVTTSRIETERSRPRRDSFSHHLTAREISPHQSIPAVVPSKTPNMPSRSISPSPDLQRLSRSRNDTSGSSHSPAGRVPSPTKDTSPTQYSLPKPPRRYSDGEDPTPGPSSTDVSRDRKDSGASVFRRRSDGDQVPPHLAFNPVRLSSNAGAARSVRWNQNLICPSPIWPEQRRKGWFNRRGDQLWTNTGTYKTPEPGDEFPLDLDGYPEPGQGWMNEDGVRIDMMHHLVPKPPLRSALKPNPRSQLLQSTTSI
ncbi:hypothetical protein IW262DRAFT_445109 [Armillaria fumosa]|nr:hypothetical protein IW262DRAFT_445109 [Armillaria fumosa]